MFPSLSILSLELGNIHTPSISAIFPLLVNSLAAYAACHLLLRCYGCYREAYSRWYMTCLSWLHRFLGILLRFGRSSYQNHDDGSKFHSPPLRYGYIRLFILEPGFWCEAIRGYFVEVSLSENTPPYEALSYCWGNLEHKDIIEINGHRLPVQENLSDALRHLRGKISPRVLWVDAICINQADSREKSEQVTLMSEIYRNAEVVQIWLGKETSSSAAGMEVLAFLSGNMKVRSLWEGSLCNEKRVNGLKDIMSRSWFERAWVVQESALSRKATLNVGHQTLSWDQNTSFRFLKRIKFAEVTPKWRDTVQVDMSPLRELLELGLRATNGVAYTPTSDLLDVVHDMRHRKATIEADRIYSVLALVPDGEGFQVDYQLNTWGVFERLYQHVRSKYDDQWGDDVDPSISGQLAEIWHSLLGRYY